MYIYRVDHNTNNKLILIKKIVVEIFLILLKLNIYNHKSHKNIRVINYLNKYFA